MLVLLGCASVPPTSGSLSDDDYVANFRTIADERFTSSVGIGKQQVVKVFKGGVESIGRQMTGPYERNLIRPGDLASLPSSGEAQT